MKLSINFQIDTYPNSDLNSPQILSLLILWKFLIPTLKLTSITFFKSTVNKTMPNTFHHVLSNFIFLFNFILTFPSTSLSSLSCSLEEWVNHIKLNTTLHKYFQNIINYDIPLFCLLSLILLMTNVNTQKSSSLNMQINKYVCMCVNFLCQSQCQVVVHSFVRLVTSTKDK